jgi:hypothetical protein
MRTTLWLGVLLSSSALVACGGGDSDPDAPVVPDAPGSADAPPGPPDADPNAPDAQPGAFTCLGQAIPTTAPTTLTVSGDVAELTTSGSVTKSGVTVNAYRTGSPTPIGTDTSDPTYSVSADNPGGTPLDGYLFTVPGNVCGGAAGAQECKNVYLYPPTRIYQDIPAAPIRTVSNNLYPVLLLAAGVSDDQEAGNGVVALIVTDCLNNPLGGAVVTSTAPGTVIRYNSGGLPSATATFTDADGVAYVFNAPTGDVTVDATYQGMDLREHAVVVHSADTENALTTTTITP